MRILFILILFIPLELFATRGIGYRGITIPSDDAVKQAFESCPLIPDQNSASISSMKANFEEISRVISSGNYNSEENNGCGITESDPTALRDYIEALNRIDDPSNPVNISGANLDCGNYQAILNDQYERFAATLRQGLIPPSNYQGSSQTYNIFDSCLRQTNTYGLPTISSGSGSQLECAQSTLLITLSQWETRCSSARIAEEENLGESATRQARQQLLNLNRDIANLISNPNCNFEDSSGSLLTNAINLGTAFGLNAAGLSPMGLGISFAGDLISRVISGFRERNEPENMSGVLEQLNRFNDGNQIMCMMREMEHLALGCGLKNLEGDARDFSNLAVCAVRDLPGASQSSLENLFKEVDGIIGVNHTTESDNTISDRDLQTITDGMVAPFLNAGSIDGNGNSQLSTILNGISHNANIDLTTQRDRYGAVINAFHGGALNLLNDRSDRAERQRLQNEYDQFFGYNEFAQSINGEERPYLVYQRILGNLRRLESHQNKISFEVGIGTQLDPTELRGVRSAILDDLQNLSELGYSFSDATERITRVHNAKMNDPTRNSPYVDWVVNARIQNGVESRRALLSSVRDEFNDTVNTLERHLKVFQFEGDNNLESVFSGILEQQKEDLNGAATPGFAAREDQRGDQWGRNIRPLLLSCMYSQTFFATEFIGNIISPRENYRGRGRRNQDPYHDACKDFFCEESPGYSEDSQEPRNPGLVRYRLPESCNNSRNRSSTGCTSPYHDFICEQKASGNEGAILNAFQNEFMRSGTICGRRSLL